jgi:GT2 family glycosyltransferase
MSIGIVVATFGADAWLTRGHALAAATAKTQTAACQVVHVHGDTLAEARNEGARSIGTDHLIFLDGDDELDRNYVQAMEQSVQKYGTNFLFQPSTLGVYPDGLTDDYPVLIPKSDNIVKRNFLIIGTMCSTEAFEEVGGFNELPALEDHELWLRMILYGCGVVTVPKAVYRVMVRPDGRNHNIKAHAEAYRRIQREYGNGTFRQAYDTYPFMGE